MTQHYYTTAHTAQTAHTAHDTHIPEHTQHERVAWLLYRREAFITCISTRRVVSLTLCVEFMAGYAGVTTDISGLRGNTKHRRTQTGKP